MELQKAIEILKQFNEWRTDREVPPVTTAPRPREITEALNTVIETYNKADVVVELSDDEIKIISEKELEQWQKDAMEYDGFDGWIVKGKLIKAIEVASDNLSKISDVDRFCDEVRGRVSDYTHRGKEPTRTYCQCEAPIIRNDGKEYCGVCGKTIE